MKRRAARQNVLLASAVLWAGILLPRTPAQADPSKYPQFAQQKLPENVTPVFISVDQLVNELTAGDRPMIIDVRTEPEYRELHIVGAISSPLAEFGAHLQNIPRDRPVVSY